MLTYPTSDDLATQIGSIRAGLSSVMGTELAGSQVRALIDATCPEFDLRAAAGVPTGPGALTKFLQTHLADIVHVIGKRGGDTLYLIGPARTETIAGNVVTPRFLNLWSAFASPSLGQEVTYDRASKLLSVQAKGAPVSDHQLRLTPISGQEFQAIAAQFIDLSPIDFHEDLRKILEEGDRFYHNWVTLLKSRPTVYHQWGLFRVQAITDLFRGRLASNDIPSEEMERAVRTLVADQVVTFKERTNALRMGASSPDKPPTPYSNTTVRAPSLGLSDINDYRSLAVAAISNMSLTELRQISVPLGALIDAGLLQRK